MLIIQHGGNYYEMYRYDNLINNKIYRRLQRVKYEPQINSNLEIMKQ